MLDKPRLRGVIAHIPSVVVVKLVFTHLPVCSMYLNPEAKGLVDLIQEGGSVGVSKGVKNNASQFNI